MKIQVTIPDELVVFAQHEAKRRGMSRSALIVWLLERERLQQEVRRYIDRHGWDVADDEVGWSKYQRRRMAQEYGDDEW